MVLCIHYFFHAFRCEITRLWFLEYSNYLQILSHILGHEFKICHSFGEYMHDWMPFRPFSLFFSRYKLVVRFNLIHMGSFIIIDCCHHCICGTYVFPIALFWTAAGFSSSDDTFKLLTTVSRISYTTAFLVSICFLFSFSLQCAAISQVTNRRSLMVSQVIMQKTLL